MDERNRDRLIAGALTLLIFALLIVALLFSYLKYPPEGVDLSQQAKPDDETILFGGEYVMVGDNPFLTANSTTLGGVDAAEEPQPKTDAADDLNDAGTVGEPSHVVTSEKESPMKVEKKPKPEKPGPTKEEIEAQQRAKREKEVADKVKGAFGGKKGEGKKGEGKGQDDGTGKKGQEDGNSPTGASKGSPGHNLGGRQIMSSHNVKATQSGTIRVSVVVNANGAVTSAKYAGGSGPAAGNAALRAKFVTESRRIKFTKRQDSDDDQRGVITWSIR